MAICRCTPYISSNYSMEVFYKIIFPNCIPYGARYCFLTGHTLCLLLLLKCLWLITEALNGSTTELIQFRMHEYYSKSPILPFYLKMGKKETRIHMQMAKTKKSTQGRGIHASICMFKLPFQNSPPHKYHCRNTYGAWPLCSSL